jgi:hypothetical protein
VIKGDNFLQYTSEFRTNLVYLFFGCPLTFFLKKILGYFLWCLINIFQPSLIKIGDKSASG